MAQMADSPTTPNFSAPAQPCTLHLAPTFEVFRDQSSLLEEPAVLGKQLT